MFLNTPFAHLVASTIQCDQKKTKKKHLSYSVFPYLKENKSLVSVEKPEKVCEFDLNLVMSQITLYVNMNTN